MTSAASRLRHAGTPRLAPIGRNIHNNSVAFSAAGRAEPLRVYIPGAGS
jgi:hypothetical protein